MIESDITVIVTDTIFRFAFYWSTRSLLVAVLLTYMQVHNLLAAYLVRN